MITSVGLQYAKALFDLGSEKHLENVYYNYYWTQHCRIWY